MKWFNQHFYEHVKKIEFEKLLFFALCYNQETLIIEAPDGSKEQEKFLGYKWSERKGREGIKIVKPGGLLYNSKDHADKHNKAAIAR